ncbi:MAG: hypothetical protein IH940_11845 [Acidobacteria bacterium]|nr:hypothetical protein [Acidobacteriota bacterium]
MNTSAPDEPIEPLVKRRLQLESAAFAGILYALLAVASLILIEAVPSSSSTSQEWAEWIGDAKNRRMLLLYLNLVSVASVMFLWFVAVIRRRVGDREDRFFATVFLGAALVHIGLWLVASSMLAAPAVLHALDGGTHLDWEAYRLAQGTAASMFLVAGPRLQAVFVASTATVFLRTGVVPNWLAYLGYFVAFGLFVVPFVSTPVGFGLPIFVMIASVTILLSRARL